MQKLRRSGDITEGVIWKQLLLFFFPLWFGSFFQQLYNTVDTVVVGRFVGKAALAAVGSTSTMVGLMIGIFTGISSGAGVVIAQHFGARRDEDVRRGVHTTMTLAILIGAICMAVGYLLAPWALQIMDTPADTLPEAQRYLRIYFLGMIPSVIYNMGTGVHRAIGDSRRPLFFLMAASLCNIVLDLVFVLGLDLGVAGVAIATVLSQVLSAVLVVLSLARAYGQPHQLSFRHLRLHGEILKSTMIIGIPAALQAVMFHFSNIVIQTTINSFGTDTVAAWATYSKMDIIFWMSINAMGLALTTFVGQNYGAGKFDRLHKSVRIAVGMSAVFTVIMSVLVTVFARPLLTIFTPDAAVLDIGVDMVRFLAPTYITYILIELLGGVFRGAGKSLPPMLVSVIGVGALRVLWMLLVVPGHHTVRMVEMSYPVTWIIASAALVIYYCKGNWLKKRKPEEETAQP